MRRTTLPLLVVGVGYACAVAATTPFTDGADLVVAIPIAALTIAVAATWSASTKALRLHAEEAPYRPWVTLLLVTAAWELFCYLAPGTRAEHPTFSSMADAADRYFALKALVVLAWLSLGCMILRRGRNGGRAKTMVTTP
jgi:hypothetical protein